MADTPPIAAELGVTETPIVRHLAMLRTAVDTLAATGFSPLDHEWVETIVLLRHLRESVRRLDATTALMERHIYLTGEHGPTVVDGIGEVWVGRSRKKERWDGAGVARAAVEQHMAERGGEAPDPHEVVEWVLEVCAIGYGRKTVMRELGIDVDVYYESEPGNISITMPKPKTS